MERNFTVDQAIQQSSSAVPGTAMDSPFPDIGPDQMQQSQQPMQMNHLVPPQFENFDQLAKRFQFDTKGLNQNPNLGRLQLMERLQKQFGPDYMQRPEARSILEAFLRRSHRQSPDDSRALLEMTSQAQRTLKGILG